MRKREYLFLANQFGSVEDIRQHLNRLRPEDEDDIAAKIYYLERSLEAERQTKKRRTVIAMIETKLYNLKLKQEQLKNPKEP